MSEQFDPGLQPERTELAWRRTTLALGIGSLVSMRMLPDLLGSPVWLLIGVAGLGCSIGFWVAAHRRYRATTAALIAQGDHAPMPGAVPIAALAAFIAAIGVTAAVVAVVAALR